MRSLIHKLLLLRQYLCMKHFIGKRFLVILLLNYKYGEMDAVRQFLSLLYPLNKEVSKPIAKYGICEFRSYQHSV